MIAAIDALEARKAELSALLAETPADTPDILPSASQLCAKKVAHLSPGYGSVGSMIDQRITEGGA